MTSLDPLGPSVLNEIAAAARTVTGVGDAVAVVRHGVRSAAPAPAPAAAAPATAVSQTGPASRHQDDDRPAAELDGGELHAPDDAPATLQEALRAAAELAPDKGTVFITRGNEDVLQTYPQLLAEAERVLAGLRAAGLRPGDAALFQFDDNRAYLTAFWACVLGGFVPTPVAVATTYRAPNDTNRRLHNVWHLLDRPPLLTDDATAAALAEVRDLWDEPDVRILPLGELLACPPDTDWYPATPDSPVLNLLTSGSTGVPKCVQHTNATVVSRSLAYARFSAMGSDEVSLLWMPFDHVTVVHCNIRDVFLRCLHVNAKIEHFLTDPLLWLDWADRYGATNTWAPNFAFAMVNEHAEEIRTKRTWDLSRFRTILNGGEPVVAATSHRFLELLAPHGLPADAMAPAWGMAETCSGVTYGRQRLDDPAAGTVAVDPASLGGTIRETDPGDRDAVVLSTVGQPIPGVRLRIVDDSGAVLPEGRMGELQIRGRTMMTGYFNNADANRESFGDDGWFRTGDLAFVRGGELVIAGRKKDQIVVRGVNYLAHEIESVVEQVEGVRVTFTAATGVREPGAGSDRLAIFFVPQRRDSDELARIAEGIRAVLVREVGLAPDLLIPVTETEFPKTGSGKVQRSALAAELRAGTFDGRVIGSAAEEQAPGTWLARRQWTELPGPTPAGGGTGVRLVLAEDDELGHLGVDGPVVAVSRGDRLRAAGPDRYRVDAGGRAQLRQLLAEVTERHGPLSAIVLGRPLSYPGEPADRLATATAELTSLLAALADGSYGTPLVLVLTAGAVHARPGDAVDLGTCALPGLVRTATAELPDLTIRQVDLSGDRDTWADAVRTELADPDHRGIVAARKGRRLEPRLSPVAEADDSSAQPPVTPGGLYLVTGGLGGIAHDIAGYLVATYGVRLLLAGRSPAEGEKAERLAELRALGEVTYEQLDVADTDALQAAVARAEARFGRGLDGVFHLAGADPTDQWADLERHTLVHESTQGFARQYRAKVSGTLALARVLEDRPEVSLVLFGSVNGEFGGHAFGAYAAANAFLAGFADHWHHARRRPVRCLAWSMWTGVGMNHGQSTAPARSRGFRPIEPADGLRLFLDTAQLPEHSLLLGLDLAHPAIVADLVPEQLRARELLLAYTADDTDGTDPEAVRAAVEPVTRDCPVPVRLVEVARIPRASDGRADTARLLLDTAADRSRRRHTPPATDLEWRIAALWADALERPETGRDDSFFDLGGNSVRATRLLALIDDGLGVRLTTQELYENPTVAQVAAIVEARGGDTE